MGLIVYEDKTLLNAKNHVDTCNGEILDALTKIYNEFNNISSTLNTPKSSKAIPEITDYYNKKIAYLKTSRESYNNMFNTISTEYNNYMQGINKMVGGNNDK